MNLVPGFCPFGCGEQLILGDNGTLRCAAPRCPRPTAAAEILADRETGHAVEIALDGQFTVRHPLRERLDNALMRCDLHILLSSEDAPLLEPGRYRADTDSQAKWFFEKTEVSA